MSCDAGPFQGGRSHVDHTNGPRAGIETAGYVCRIPLAQCDGSQGRRALMPMCGHLIIARGGAASINSISRSGDRGQPIRQEANHRTDADADGPLVGAEVGGVGDPMQSGSLVRHAEENHGTGDSL